MQTRNENGQFGTWEDVKGFKGVGQDGKAACGKRSNPPYAPGKTYTVNSKKKLELCSNTGIHFCQKAEDVWGYYPPTSSKYIEVTAHGKCVTDELWDSKTVTRKLTFGERFMGALEFARKFFRRITPEYKMVGSKFPMPTVVYTTKGQALSDSCVVCCGKDQYISSSWYIASFSDNSYIQSNELAVNFGYYSIAASNRLALSTSRGIAYAAKKNAVAVSGVGGHAAGVLGSILVFITYSSDRDKIFVKQFEVDGENVKPNVAYRYSYEEDRLVDSGKVIFP